MVVGRGCRDPPPLGKDSTLDSMILPLTAGLFSPVLLPMMPSIGKVQILAISLQYCAEGCQSTEGHVCGVGRKPLRMCQTFMPHFFLGKWYESWGQICGAMSQWEEAAGT